MKPTIFGLSAYHLFINLGIVFGSLAFFIVKYRRTKSIKKSVFGLAICLAVFGVGAIAGEAVRTWSLWEFRSFSGFLRVMVSDRAGTHFVGRVLFAAWILPFLYKTEAFDTYDAVSFYFVIQHIFNRMGCFFTGCCYGKYYEGPGSVVFPTMQVDYPVYPTQLMEAVATAVLLLILLVRWRRGKPLFGWALMVFGMIIFISEFFMDQSGVLRIAGINMIQVTAFLTLLSGVLYIEFFKRKEKKVS